MQKVSASGIVTSHHQNFLNTNPLDPKYSGISLIYFLFISIRIQHCFLQTCVSSCATPVAPALVSSMNRSIKFLNLAIPLQMVWFFIVTSINFTCFLKFDCCRFIADVKQQKENVLKLSQFQFAVVKHAMSFPSVQRVSYSTCSINQV
jgi:hypothetical protein